MRRIAGGLLIVAVALSLGCRGEFSQQPGNIELRVAVSPDAVELLHAQDVGELPNPPVTEEAVHFTFQPVDGSTPVEGTIRDSRILRAEFDAMGQPDPVQLVSDSGIFDVRVPATPGRLELKTAAGDMLGVLDVDPEAPVTRTQALMREEDVIGQPVKIVDHGDPANKVDVLFLPEGYREDQMQQFHAHVQSIVDQMKTHSGYKDHWQGFNFWRQDVRSRTVGAGANGVPVDTAFETAAGVSGLERCVFFANNRGREAALRLGARVGAQATVVLVNSTAHGGCANDGVVVSSRPAYVADVVSHELGHALFGLADEYESPRGGGYCDHGPNVSTSSRLEALPWADMVNTRELPTPATARFGTVGAFEGGGYCSYGRYRPTHNCMMRNLGVGMCPVCKREMARTMAALAPPQQNEDTQANSRPFTITNKTDGDLWVRCDGPTRAGCSDWTYISNGMSSDVSAPDGRMILHNKDIAGVTVGFDMLRVEVVSRQVTFHPNATDPFNPPFQVVEISHPRNLSPDLTYVYDRQTELTWNAVEGAAYYRVVVEVEDGGVWRAFDDQQTMDESLTVTLANVNTRYRWRVAACNDTLCTYGLQALFTARVASSNSGSTTTTTTTTTTTNTTTVPGVPTNLSPADASDVTGGTARLKWSAPGAESFNVEVLSLPVANSDQWEPFATMTNLRATDTSVNLSYRGRWYAFSVQACNSAGCSEWTGYSMFYGR